MGEVKYLSSNPLVTIGIPTFNRGELAYRAVKSALSQTYQNIEVIVSDNASTDETLSLIQSIDDNRLKIIRQQKNMGAIHNCNVCINNCSGDYYLFLSDDDYLEPQAIELLIEPFLKNEEVGVVYCQTRVVDQHDNELYITSTAPEYENSFDLICGIFKGTRENYPCSILMRKKDITLHGGYKDDIYSIACDGGLWMTIALNYKQIAFKNKPLASFRLHLSGVTSGANLDQWRTGLEAIAKSCYDICLDRYGITKAQILKEDGEYFVMRTLLNLITQSVRKGATRSQAIKQYKSVVSLNNLYWKLTLINLIKILIPNSLFYKLKRSVGS